MGNRKKTILIPDDNNAYMMLVYIQLKKMGFSVVPFYSVDEVLDKAMDSSASMVFMDIGITGIDCIKAMKKIKTNKRTKNLPMVVISSDPSEAKRDECLALGAESFLMRPLNIYEMHEVMQRCLYVPMGYHRDHLRVCFSGRVLLAHNGVGEWLYSDTLSERGIYIRKKYPYAVGSEVVVSLPLYGDKSISIEGSVVYINRGASSEATEPTGMAIEFSDKDLDKLVVISDYVVGLLTIPSMVMLQNSISCGA